jgi:hypothetical protein
VSEKDLGLKADVRRLLWRIGLTTKVDVPLRAYVPDSTTGPGYQSYTDLDVLGINVGRDARILATIADCKTSSRGSTERMFWIRGVADFFGADDAYMVRASAATAASRQLASRLGVTVVTPTELSLLESFYPSRLPLEEEGLSFLFDPSAIETYRSAIVDIDRRVRPLLEYAQFDFWVYDEHRNLLQLVAHLSAVAKHLDQKNPVHRALFFECSWLFTLALLRAIQHVRRTHVGELDTSMREYLFGGELGLREKRELARVLRQAAGKPDRVDDLEVLPPYFSLLLDVMQRFMRRPANMANVLRYAEWLAEAQVAKHAQPLSEVFGNAYDDVAAKLLADACAFLVSAADLPADLRTESRRLLAPNGRVAPSSISLVDSATAAGSHPPSGAQRQPGRKTKAADPRPQFGTANAAGKPPAAPEESPATDRSPDSTKGQPRLID